MCRLSQWEHGQSPNLGTPPFTVFLASFNIHIQIICGVHVCEVGVDSGEEEERTKTCCTGWIINEELKLITICVIWYRNYHRFQAWTYSFISAICVQVQMCSLICPLNNEATLSHSKWSQWHMRSRNVSDLNVSNTQLIVGTDGKVSWTVTYPSWDCGIEITPHTCVLSCVCYVCYMCFYVYFCIFQRTDLLFWLETIDCI